MCVALGFLATVVTGEFTISWSYLLVDVPLVACAAMLGFLSAPHLRRTFSRTYGDS